MIYHVTSTELWEQAKQTGYYEAPSLKTEGFIHSSEKHQVQGVLDRYYKGVTGLLLLHIDETKLAPKLVYEMAPSVNEAFPHIYGPINIDAIIKTELL